MQQKSTTFLILLLILKSFASNDLVGNQLDSIINNLINGYRLWKNIENQFPDIPGIISTCKQGFKKQLKNNQTWNFFDASGKPRSGISQGNIYWLGDYKECLNLTNSKYCTLLNIKVEKKPTVFGACVPSVCDENDIERVFGWVENLTGIYFDELLTVDPHPLADYWGNYNVSCTTGNEDKKEWKDAGTDVIITIMSLIAMLNVIGTVLDIFRKMLSWEKKDEFERNILVNTDDGSVNVTSTPRRQQAWDSDIRTLRNVEKVKLEIPGHPATKFFMCFSLIRNTKAIFKTTTSRDIIKVANGIRFFSLCWIILGHMLFYAVLYAPVDNVIYIKSLWLHRFTMQALTNSTVAVDTFFLLSGMLVNYLCLKRLISRVGNTQNAINCSVALRYYLHRLVRILPVYLFVLGFFIFIFPELSGGPFWFPHEKKSYKWQNCRKYWWTNVIFLNDLYPDTNLGCFEWSWYLAVDMQFYLASPLFVFLIKDMRLSKLSMLLLIVVASLSTKGYLLYHLNATPIFNTETFQGVEKYNLTSPLMQYLDKIYTKPYTRITPYLIGMVLGWCLFKEKKLPDNKKVLISAVCWLIFIAVTSVVVYGPVYETHWSVAVKISYGVLFRPAWALSVAWLIYACHTGYGEMLDKFLSWKFFLPFTRISFSTYLVHVMVIMIFYGSLQQPMHVDDISFFCLYFGIVFISYFVGYLLTVFVEYPLYQLGEIFF